MNIRALSLSAVFTNILIIILTILGEISNSVHNFLTSVTGHHWVTKGVFSLVFFFGLYFLTKNIEEYKDSLEEIKLVLWSSILGILIIFLFYVWHFLS